jgi:LmbE family N-acetylglucosaminyl deacetylase
MTAPAARPTPTDMRDWGLVAPGELERIVIVSPHLDDAVLGCSHLMSAHPGVTVVTVFAGRPREYPTPMERWDSICGFVEGDEVHVARRAEDAAALAVLDANPVWLDFVEHSYLPRAEWPRPEDVVETLTTTIAGLAPTAVFAPFGLANPDHGCTHEAAMLVRDRLSNGDTDGIAASSIAASGIAWFCYEDMGYKHIPGLLAWRISKLFRQGQWPTPAAVPVDPDLTRKQAAVDCYPSQLRALEAEWQVGAKLAAPAPEQHWRLAPPPPGWEGLRD